MARLLNYHRYENFLEPSDVKDLLDYCVSNKNNFQGATTHNGKKNSIDNGYRSSLVFRDLSEFREMIINRLNNFLPDIYDKLQISEFEIKSHELEIAVHGNGAFFKEHIDTFTGDRDKGKARTISAVYYFFSEPKRFSGGELKLIPMEFLSGDDEAIALTPVNNSLIVFPSFAPHEVLPIKCPEVGFEDWRFTINCWLYK